MSMSLTATVTDVRDPHYQALKGRIHQELLNRLNLDRLTKTQRADAEPEIRGLIQSLLDVENQRVGAWPTEMATQSREIQNLTLGQNPPVP